MLNFPSLPRRNAEVRTDFLFRHQHKPILPRFIPVNRVFRQRALAPRVCAADAVDVEVDIEVDEIAALNIRKKTVIINRITRTSGRINPMKTTAIHPDLRCIAWAADC